MKKLFAIIAASICLSAAAQEKQTAKQDSVKTVTLTLNVTTEQAMYLFKGFYFLQNIVQDWETEKGADAKHARSVLQQLQQIFETQFRAQMQSVDDKKKK